MLNWLQRQKQTDWIVRQLNLQPHQHLLEAGCGSGRHLAAVATQLRNNFLAAVELSHLRYHLAVRRNATFIRQDMVQLHLGHIADLPYPAGYFHTIYSCGNHHAWKNYFTECLRLSNLLHTGGRLILFSQPGRYRSDDEMRTEAARLQAACQKAGLTDMHTEYQHFSNGICFAVSGSKHPDYPSITTINNRLLNREASFISKVSRMQYSTTDLR